MPNAIYTNGAYSVTPATRQGAFDVIHTHQTACSGVVSDRVSGACMRTEDESREKAIVLCDGWATGVYPRKGMVVNRTRIKR